VNGASSPHCVVNGFQRAYPSLIPETVKPEANALLEPSMEGDSGNRKRNHQKRPYNVAVIHVRFGNKDEAFAGLERAFAERSYLLVEYFNTDERLESLKSDRRFAELRRRIGLPRID